MDIAELNAKYPLQFATPCLIGNPKLKTAPVDSGTVTLLRYHDRNYGVTCQHVVERFRQARLKDEQVQFFLGQTQIDIDNCLVGEDEADDLAIFDLSEYRNTELTTPGSIVNGFANYVDCEEAETNQGDFVVLGGFPGTYRIDKGSNHYFFDSFSYGQIHVAESSISSIRIEAEPINGNIIFNNFNHDFPDHFGLSLIHI